MAENRGPRVAVWIETSRGYGRGLIRGVANYVRQHGPWSIYFTPHGLREPFAAWLKKWKGDGILCRIDDRRMAQAFSAANLPLIDLRGRIPELGIPIVGLDNRPIGRMAFEHLHERGFRHYAFCGLPAGEHVHLDMRREFFCEAVAAAGFECHVFAPSRPRRKALAWEQEEQQMEAWLSRLPRPIGVMCCNDDRAQQLLDACRRLGIAIPDEMAVVGVDNDEELCNLSTPALSSIDVSAARIGFAAAELLDAMMLKMPKLPNEILFPPSHVVTRLSTDTLAIEDRDLARAVRFIRDHACEAIGVEDVVRAAHMSRRHLERRIFALLGRSPNQEILRVRINRAQLLLLETDLPLAVIARQTGFQGAKYFGDVFVRQTGEPPGEFRRRVRESRQYHVALHSR